MRVVLDTNTVISGILWGNQPRQILDLAKADKIKLYTSKVLLDELLDVLSRPKFAKRLISVVQSTPQEILLQSRLKLIILFLVIKICLFWVSIKIFLLLMLLSLSICYS